MDDESIESCVITDLTGNDGTELEQLILIHNKIMHQLAVK